MINQWLRPTKNQWLSEVWTFVLAYIRVNELIKGSHPGTKDRDIWTYPERSGPNMVLSIFAMTVQPKQPLTRSAMYRFDHKKRDITDMDTSGKIPCQWVKGASREVNTTPFRARDVPKGVHINTAMSCEIIRF